MENFIASYLKITVSYYTKYQLNFTRRRINFKNIPWKDNLVNKYVIVHLFRPIIHREALAGSRRKSMAPLRPVMDRITGARRESGAQTDISALPAHWRSESYLAHKVAHTFTTLPSKFALPAGVPGRLRLSDKTREARRVMLSDISFTSMVPELSRSADHLCHDSHAQVGSELGSESS